MFWYSAARLRTILKMARITKEMRAYFAELGRKGGKKGGLARARALTAEQRSASARKAVTARWTKRKS